MFISVLIKKLLKKEDLVLVCLKMIELKLYMQRWQKE